MIDHRAAAEDAILIGTAGRGRQRHRQMFPMHHVFADGVAPVHIAPKGAVRIVLVEHVILALPVDGRIGIVHPIGRGKQMILGSVRIGRQLGSRRRGSGQR